MVQESGSREGHMDNSYGRFAKGETLEDDNAAAATSGGASKRDTPCRDLTRLPEAPVTKPQLSCLMYQLSADLGLGIPFNIASYALLTHMIARVTDTDAHELIIQLGDAHVYKDHVEALEEQLKRELRPFPKHVWRREDVGKKGILSMRTLAWRGMNRIRVSP
ncbi:thymidylate synthase/dCMP hydroxymethylase domain-containing protein [Ephemerocybe angulata]|uniref:thymidylate synthase n=1 Tax=Ephemerocybe angulata TaxID=980116 RepID=A0A8H6I5K2_9AGAR|nr:thymidylate synthase/dCMP hydroxymethylase domain-containing protein [Tulosesus angulatus]